MREKISTAKKALGRREGGASFKAQFFYASLSTISIPESEALLSFMIPLVAARPLAFL